MTPFVHAFTAALLHFVWQGALVAALLRAALLILRDRSANSRYLASCLAMALLTALPAITLFAVFGQVAKLESATPAAVLESVAIMAVQSFSPRIEWMSTVESWVFPFWVLGVILFSFRMGWGCAAVSAFRRRGAPVDGALLSRLASLSSQLGVTRRVQVLVSAAADGPAVVGWIRPVILLPASMLTGFSTEHLEAVLVHELTHVRRHDYLVNLLQMSVETLLFYHPAVWWVSSRIRHERELCCDDLAASALGTLHYAHALTALEKLRVSAPSPAMGAAGGSLFYRIQRLVGRSKQEYGLTKLAGALAVSLALACGAMSVKWARGQSQAAPVPSTATPSVAQARPELPKPAAEPRAPLPSPVQPVIQKQPEDVEQLSNKLQQLYHEGEQLRQAASRMDAEGLNAQLREAEERLKYMNQVYSAAHPEVIAQESKLVTIQRLLAEDLDQRKVRLERDLDEKLQRLAQLAQELGQKQIAANASRVLAGRRVAIIDARGVGADLHLPVQIGDVLTDNTIGQIYEVVKEFDGRLSIVFKALEDGGAELRISAAGALRKPRRD